MSSRIHPQARTAPKIRQEIKDSGLSDLEAAKVFGITPATAAKCLKRNDVQDRSHRAHTLHTTLNAAQEAIVLTLRQSLYAARHSVAQPPSCCAAFYGPDTPYKDSEAYEKAIRERDEQREKEKENISNQPE